MNPRDPRIERTFRRKLWRNRRRFKATMAGENRGYAISGLCWSFLFAAQLQKRSDVPEWLPLGSRTEYLRRALRDAGRNRHSVTTYGQVVT
jgi:hypothetical protein